MNYLNIYMIPAGILFVLIIISGLWLRKTGSPYKSGVVTLHKLLSIVFIAVSALFFRRLFYAETVNPGDTWLVIILGVTVLLALITGGILSYRNTKHYLLILGHILSTIVMIVIMAILFIHVIRGL